MMYPLSASLLNGLRSQRSMKTSAPLKHNIFLVCLHLGQHVLPLKGLGMKPRRLRRGSTRQLNAGGVTKLISGFHVFRGAEQLLSVSRSSWYVHSIIYCTPSLNNPFSNNKSHFQLMLFLGYLDFLRCIFCWFHWAG